MALTQELLQVEKIAMISNDNAFLNTFGHDDPFMQRTLFARLGSPQDDPILVAKPIFHLWTLLALQGNPLIRNI